jgi:hypothetical protein
MNQGRNCLVPPIQIKPLALLRLFRAILLEIFKLWRLSDETYHAAFVMRTLLCQVYEYLRGLISLPQVKLLDERFKADLDVIQMQSTQLEHPPILLDQYKTTHISDQYSGALPVTTENETSHAEIPVILGVDAMAIEPYSEKSREKYGINRLSAFFERGALPDSSPIYRNF